MKIATEPLDALAGFVQDHHISEGFFVAIIFAHNELDFELHGSRPPVWVTPVGLILLQTDEIPPSFDALLPTLTALIFRYIATPMGLTGA
jgi:hypothetical protein